MPGKRTEAAPHGMIPTGIVPYAKRPGITSFSSLWAIKKSLGTDKVGHTGTLDSFAEGLLVALTGNLTHLVPHITSFTKTYQAVICFGKGTETLDPTVTPGASGPSVTETQVLGVLDEFTGAILQVPPVYSAVHVAGKRASDVARGGGDVRLEPRQVFVYTISLLDFREPSAYDSCSYALLEIKCSKGTYIRALARDIASRLGTVSYLCALRRTRVGPFTLDDAAGGKAMPCMTIDYALENSARIMSGAARNSRDSLTQEEFLGIRGAFRAFTPGVAAECGLTCERLLPEYERAYQNGRPLSWRMFAPVQQAPVAIDEELRNKNEAAVFYSDGGFAGVVRREEGRPRYGFVVPAKPAERKTRVFLWQDILTPSFPAEWISRGTALTVGSFDGMHLGHSSLIQSVVSHAEKNGLVPGAVTFRSSAKKLLQDDWDGELTVLEQKLELFAEKGMAFVVVIDFSPDFSKMDGTSFMETLRSFCGMRFLAEGKDFRCGHNGSMDMDSIKELSLRKGFVVETVPDVSGADFDGGRISSSAIRGAVMRADFWSAQKMLGRPFSFYAANLSWHEEDSRWFAASCEESMQVLPADGVYDVVAIMSGGYALEDSVELNKVEPESFHTKCRVHGRMISLLVPGEFKAEKVRTVNFFKE